MGKKEARMRGFDSLIFTEVILFATLVLVFLTAVIAYFS